MDVSRLTPGLKGRAQAIVDEARTARAQGSGSEAVFATPAMVALMEEAAVAATAAHLPDDTITLGTRVAIDHLAATPLGASVSATAELTAISGRTLTFSVTAYEDEKLIGQGTHIRAVVDRKRFLDRLAQNH